MDSPNEFWVKFKCCKNCFSIVQNDHYVVAVGDQIVTYRKNDWGMQCLIPSKTFAHPYSLRFLSDHIFIVKNNYGKYMVYDLKTNEILWTFKLRGYDSIDVHFAISPDGRVVYDILTHYRGEPCCVQIAIFPESKQYETRELFETAITVDGWQDRRTGCTSSRIYQGDNEDLYLLNEYQISNAKDKSYTVVYWLFQNSMKIEEPWKPVKKWYFDKPMAYRVLYGDRVLIRDAYQKPIYIDAQRVIWNSFLCEHISGGDCQSIANAETLLTPDRMKRIIEPKYGVDFWFFDAGSSHEFRQYETWEPIQQLYNFEKHFNERICDVAVLDRDGRKLLGTYTGLYLEGYGSDSV